MREQDFIMTENKKDMLSVAGVQIAQAYDSAVKLK